MSMENGSEIQLLVYQEGYVRLFLEGGEDRLAKNRETCHKGKVISYHAVSEEWFLLSSLVLPPLEQLIEKRADSGIDGTSDRTAKRHCNSVFLLWGNTVGDCKGTWHYTATVSQTLVTALRRMRDSQKKDSPSGKKADFKRVK